MLFDATEAQKTMDADKKSDRWAEGKYVGRIAKATPKTSKSGYKMVELSIKVEGHKGYFFHNINLDHPNAAAISQKTLLQIFTYGYTNPPSKLETAEEVAMALTGAPVAMTVKDKGETEQGYPRYGVFFNAVGDTMKADFTARSSQATTTTPSGTSW